MELKEVCSLFIKNRDIIQSKHKLEWPSTQSLCALLMTDKNQTVDLDKIKECKKLLKAKTKGKIGLTLNMRGIIELVIVTLLSSYDNPAEKVDETLALYGELKNHFWGSEYLAIGALILTDYTSDYENISVRAREIYDDMKKQHPLLTSSDDAVLTLLLALSEKSNTQLITEMEKHYDILKEDFGKTNAVQALSHVLTLEDGNAKEVIDFYDRLKLKGYKYGKYFELPSLGILTKLGDRDIIMKELIQVDEFLSEQKGYGMLSIGKKERLLHASVIVTIYHMHNEDFQTGISTSTASITGIIIAQTVALVTTVIVAANSSNNSGN